MTDSFKRGDCVLVRSDKVAHSLDCLSHSLIVAIHRDRVRGDNFTVCDSKGACGVFKADELYCVGSSSPTATLPTQVGPWWYERDDGQRLVADVYRCMGTGPLRAVVSTKNGDVIFPLVDDDFFIRWLGPVNPEPLPMPFVVPVN